MKKTIKTKIGITLLTCSLVLSSAPLPLILADEVTTSPETTTLSTPENLTQPESLTTPEANSETQDTSNTSEPVEENEQTDPTTDETNETDETQLIETTDGVFEDTRDYEGEYVYDETIQQELRDLAMALTGAEDSSDQATSGRRVRRSASPAAYATTTPANFIKATAKSAQKVANQHGLYASVMIAQAALETGYGNSTLGAPPNHNLFGIKGSYNGQSVKMATSEFLNGKWVTVYANFRKYPNYELSFQDNGKLLRYGLIGAPNFYSGTWKKNTKSYKDATAWLAGRYATDPTYNVKLNNIIEKNNLTQYDNNQTNPNNYKIKTNQKLNKGMKVADNSFYIYTQPYNTPNSIRSQQIYSRFSTGSRVEVTNLVTTTQGVKTYYIKNVGWVDHRALEDYATLKKQSTVNKTLRIGKSNFYIYNKPYNIDGSKRVVHLGDKYNVNDQVKITSEATTSQGVQVKYIDKVGWVDYRAFSKLATKKSESTVNKSFRIKDNDYFFYGAPYNTLGGVRQGQIKDKLPVNAPVTATKYVVTSTGVKTYYLQGYGWVDYKALRDNAKISSQTPKKTSMRIKNNEYNIYSAPFNTAGSVLKSSIKDKLELNTEVQVTKYVVTSDGVRTYYLEGYGWVDYRALKDNATLKSQKSMNKTMRIKNDGYFIYATPFNTKGSKRDAQLKDKSSVNTSVTVTKYAETSEGIKTYYLKDYKGWVDYRALRDHAKINTQKTVNTPMRIKNNQYFFYSAPFNTNGSARKAQIVDEYAINDLVTPTKYVVTSDGIKTYYIDNHGWVDYRALKEVATISSSQVINTPMKIKNNGYFIYSEAFNTKNAKRGEQLKDKLALNSNVTATKYVVTSEGVKTYYLKGYGWVDYRAVANR